ncbi:MAG: hypothetical protein AAGB04_03660 [Pseudomonadota bacterium]
MVAKRDETNLELIFHPAEQPALFSLGLNEVAFAARTSNGGPGYHVYMVDLLRYLERQCTLKWVEDEDAGEIDETNYFSSGDFQDVIEQMDGWLKLNLSYISEVDEDSETLAIGLPTHLTSAAIEPGYVLTARGPVDSRTLKKSADLDNEEFRSFADNWYVWPSAELDLAFWERTSNALLWCEVPWHPPRDDNDEWSYSAARHALEQFRRAGGDANLFNAEDTEIAQMLSNLDTDELPPPFPDGRGYLRRRLDRTLQNYWSIRIPGYWYIEQTDDDAAYWYSNMTIRSSLMMIKSDPGRTASDLLIEIVKEEASNGSKNRQVQNIVEDGFIGFVQDGEEPSDANFGMLGRYANDDSILIVSCYFDDKKESATAWDYLRSVKFTGPPPETVYVDNDGMVEKDLN